MKKVLGLFLLATAVGGAAFALRDRAEAMPQVTLPLVRLICNGTNGCCNGNGVREFTYEVKVATGASVTQVDVGTHIDGNPADYINRVMPAGWTFSLVPATPRCAGFVCTPHGSVSAQADLCSWWIRFQGPAQTTSFTLGFDFIPDFDIHDVSWKASTGNQSNWAQRVGLGLGPVHSPMIQ